MASSMVNPGGLQPLPKLQTGQTGQYDATTLNSKTAVQPKYDQLPPPPAAPAPAQQPTFFGGMPVDSGAAAPNANPNGAKPAGVSDSAWYGYTKVDSTKPLAWWQAQDQYYDPSSSGYARYRSAKLDANGNPIQGLYEHPDACPDGTTAFGKNQCLSTSDPRVAPYLNGPDGGGPGGKGGPGGGGSGDYMASISRLADTLRGQAEKLFGTSFPALQQAAEYWKGVSGEYGQAGVTRATAPAAEEIAATYRGAGKQLRNLRGADKDAAESDLARQEAGQIGGLGERAQEQAAGQLGQIGEYGITTGMQGTEHAAQIGLGQEEDTTKRWLGKLQADTSWKIASLQSETSRYGIDQQSKLGWAGLNQHGQEWQQNFGEQQKEWNDKMNQWNQQFQYQQDSNNSSFWGGLFGTGVKLFGDLAIAGVL